MSEVPLGSIIYVVLNVVVVLALPIYFVFFRKRKKPSIPPSSDHSKEKLIVCPVCGRETHLSATGKCSVCGMDMLAPSTSTQVKEGADEITLQPPSEKLLSWRELFGKALGLYRKRFGDLVPLCLTSSIFTCIVIGVFAFVVPLRVGEESYQEIFKYLVEDSQALGIAIVGVLFLPLIMFWSQLAFLYAHVETQNGQKGCFSKATVRVFPYMGLCFVYFCGIVVGGVFLIVPGVWLALQHVLAPAVFVAEEGGPLDVLRKSRSYAKGRQTEIFPKILVLAFFAVLAFYSSLLFAIPETTREAPLPILLTLMVFPITLFGHFSFTCLFLIYQEIKTTPAEEIQIRAEQEPFMDKQGMLVGDFIGSAWRAYKRRALNISAIQILIYMGYVFPAIGTAILLKKLFQLYDKYFPGGYEWMTIPSPQAVIWGFLLIVFSFLLVFVSLTICYVITLYGSLTMTYAISDESIGIGSAFRKARERLIPYTWLSLWRDILIALGSIFFLPGLFFRIKYAFSPFVYALENERGLNALAKSSAYTKAYPAIFRKILIVELLMSLLKSLNHLVLHAFSLLIFAPLLVFSGLLLAFYVGIFALLGIPYGIYVEIYSVLMAKFFIFLPMVLALFFLPALMMLYYFQLYKSVKALEKGQTSPDSK
jgi:hypothetical protein